MLVSCICPTYGRAPDYLHLLEESIESFRRQDWPDKELIVFNDAKTQELQCDVSGVRVINGSSRVSTLGEKYNIAIEAAEGDLLCPWEDDDLALPWRLSLSVELLGNADYFNPQRQWYLNSDGLHCDHPQGYCHNCSMFRRSAWEQVGGYPETSGPQDAQMDGALRSQCTVADYVELPVQQWYYIYRWGVSPNHLSSRGDHGAFYDEVGRQPVEAGTWHIKPHWRQNYLKLCSDMVKDNDHAHHSKT